MAQQKLPNRIRFMFSLDLMDAARLRTYIKGKEVPAKACGGRKLRKLTKQMSPSDCVEGIIKGILEDVTPDVESIGWMNERYEANLKIREQNDALVRSGLYRKPRSEWKKRGRVPGKSYKKHSQPAAKETASKRLGCAGTAKRKASKRR